ncbi:MAG: hypothetical protein L6R28_23630 [Planctomycetes bacterium]|nr:hypothetical protein [Planctomycetota bacterium]
MTDAPLEPKKKRAWFQLHLSTCVVLSMLAGLLLIVNLGMRQVRLPGSEYRLPYKDHVVGEILHRPKEFGAKVQGWPFAFYRLGTDAWDYRMMVANAGVAVGILALAALACEHRIRRHARKRESRSA